MPTGWPSTSSTRNPPDLVAAGVAGRGEVVPGHAGMQLPGHRFGDGDGAGRTILEHRGRAGTVPIGDRADGAAAVVDHGKRAAVAFPHQPPAVDTQYVRFTVITFRVIRSSILMGTLLRVLGVAPRKSCRAIESQPQRQVCSTVRLRPSSIAFSSDAIPGETLRCRHRLARDRREPPRLPPASGWSRCGSSPAESGGRRRAVAEVAVAQSLPLLNLQNPPLPVETVSLHSPFQTIGLPTLHSRDSAPNMYRLICSGW